MYRLLLLALLSVFALNADIFTSTTCTSGSTIISPCGGSYLVPGGLPNAMAGASASDTGVVDGALPDGQPPITGGWTMSTGAAASVQGSATVIAQAQAHASAFDTFLASGPSRPGFIQFNVTMGQLHGGDSTVVLTDGTNTYSYEAEFGAGSTPPFGTCFEGCQWASTVPFELGVPFQVTASSNDSESSLDTSTSIAHGNTDAIVTFRLLEADGTTPVPFSVIPEPSAWALSLAGFVALGFCLRSRFPR